MSAVPEKMSVSEAGKLISESSRIVLCTHAMPDGDGLGAEIALYHYLVRLGKDVRIINPDQLPPRYRFLDPAGSIEIAGQLRTPFNGADLAIVVDTGDYRRLGPLWPQLESSCGIVVFLDHHPRLPDECPPAPTARGAEVYDVIDVRSSSIGELLYRLFHVAHDVLDPVNPSFRLAPEIALGLYVSIITDTNSFRYAKTTALSHRIAADLIDYGLQPELIYQNIYSTKSVDHLRLIGTALSEVSQTDDGQVAWVEITKSLRQKHKASGDDTQNIVNFMLLLQDPEVLVMLREEDDGRIKASLKSKGQVVVNRIAAEFGGGGHDFASGFTAKGSMSDVRTKLLERLREEIRARR